MLRMGGVEVNYCQAGHPRLLLAHFWSPLFGNYCWRHLFSPPFPFLRRPLLEPPRNFPLHHRFRGLRSYLLDTALESRVMTSRLMTWRMKRLHQTRGYYTWLRKFGRGIPKVGGPWLGCWLSHSPVYLFLNSQGDDILVLSIEISCQTSVSEVGNPSKICSHASIKISFKPLFDWSCKIIHGILAGSIWISMTFNSMLEVKGPTRLEALITGCLVGSTSLRKGESEDHIEHVAQCASLSGWNNHVTHAFSL